MTEQEAVALRAVGTNEYKWTYSNVRIGKDEIGDFEILANHRDLRKGHITRIFRTLCKGDHFESGLVVNKRGRKLRLIDGNHRITAIQRFLEKYPERHVLVALHVYDNLTDDEEKEKFNIWNKGVKQSTNDYIRLYFDDVPLFRRLRKPLFPVDVWYVWKGNEMEVKLLLNAFFGTKAPNYVGYARMNGEDFIKRVQQMTKDDVALLKAFMSEYVSVFGEPDKQSVWYRAVVFSGMMDMWMRNAQNVPVPAMTNRMKRLLRNALVLSWALKPDNMDNCILCRRDIIDAMNKNISKNLVM